MGSTKMAPVSVWELDTGVRSAGTAALHAVRAVAADETWAVGGVVDPDSGRMRGLVARWAAGEFRFVRPADVPRGLDVSLFGVDAAGQYVWAVGAVSDGAGGGRARIERYSRRQVTGVAVPGPAVDRNNALHAVSMVAPDEGWAVGGCGPDADSAFTRPLIARWDGTVWRAVPCPRPKSLNRLDAVSARRTDDVWAVGHSSDRDCEDRPEALVLHWNGERWQQVRVPDRMAEGTELRAVAAVARDSVWATGSTTVPGQAHRAGVVLHWDGKRWRSIRAEEPVTEVTGVAAAAEDDIWLSAYAMPPGGTENVYVARWDGERVLPEFTGPLPQGHVGSALNGISVAGDRVTAVGWRMTTDTPFQLPAALLGCSSAPA